jgi:hypothetical protein
VLKLKRRQPLREMSISIAPNKPKTNPTIRRKIMKINTRTFAIRRESAKRTQRLQPPPFATIEFNPLHKESQ